MIIQQEPFSSFRKDAKDLIAPYLAEVTTAFEKDVNWDHYQTLADQGYVHVITARKDGALKGFLPFIAYEHPNNVGTMFAQELALFLLPEERKGLTGVRLIKTARRVSKELGCQYFMITTRPGKDLGPLLTALGAKLLETNYIMEV